MVGEVAEAEPLAASDVYSLRKRLVVASPSGIWPDDGEIVVAFRLLRQALYLRD